MSSETIYASTKCPRCGSDNVTVLVERHTENFDLCSGILGTVCFGPIGLLCGICGAGGEQKRISCTCNDCGAHFNR